MGSPVQRLVGGARRGARRASDRGFERGIQEARQRFGNVEGVTQRSQQEFQSLLSRFDRPVRRSQRNTILGQLNNFVSEVEEGTSNRIRSRRFVEGNQRRQRARLGLNLNTGLPLDQVQSGAKSLLARG